MARLSSASSRIGDQRSPSARVRGGNHVSPTDPLLLENVGNLPVPHTPPRSSANRGWPMSVAAWHAVGPAGDEPAGALRQVEVEGRAVCIGRTAGGWVAFDDTCTHEECSLAGGELDEGVIVCPCHGS